MLDQAHCGPRKQIHVFATLLFAVFVVALGTGFILPILPSMIERVSAVEEDV